MQIAVLDEDRGRLALVCETLRTAGHACEGFMGSDELLAHAERHRIDLLIADAAMPGISRLREPAAGEGEDAAAVPLLLLVDRPEETLPAVLNAGLADYLVKPIRRGELALRVRVLDRRAHSGGEASEQIRFGEYAFDIGSGRLTVGGRPVELTQKEFELALLLFRNLGRPLSRAYLLEKIWSGDTGIPSRTVDTHVSRVRSKLGLRPERGFWLVSVYGYGYRLEQAGV